MAEIKKTVVSSTTQRRELDRGKSTVKGEINYTEGGKSKSVITDADTLIDIGEILAGTKHSKMNANKLASALQDRGYEVEVFTFDSSAHKGKGRQGIRFKNGDILADSAGDAAIGMQDVNFSGALSKVEDKFGLQLGGLKDTLEQGEIARQLKKQAEKIGSANASIGLYSTLAQSSGVSPVDSDDIASLMREVQMHMDNAGYEGQDTAHDLWRNGELSAWLEKLGLNHLEVPSAQNTAYDMAMTRALGLFGLAFTLAGRLGTPAR